LNRNSRRLRHRCSRSPATKRADALVNGLI